MSNNQQPWIHSLKLDSTFILLPPFITLLLVAFLPDEYKSGDAMPARAWVGLVLRIDVAHVYSTLYRTYFDKDMQQQHRSLLINIPLLAFIGGVLLYTISAMAFWRIMAYIAVFHFIRQQYGFVRLYGRKENTPRYSRIIDGIAIYAATVYPILYWHLSGQRNFDWFVQGDFYYFRSDILLYAGTVVYITAGIVYLVKETVYSYKSRTFNLPKNMIVAGTWLSWYFGIVHFNGDIAFTALNVISHGIPYMALIWVYGKRKTDKQPQQAGSFLRMVFSSYGVVLFLLLIFALSYLEEGIWDALVWNDHRQIFGAFYFMPQIKSSTLLAIIVPLLTLPQLTHYIIDGFIWKVRSSSELKE